MARNLALLFNDRSEQTRVLPSFIASERIALPLKNSQKMKVPSEQIMRLRSKTKKHKTGRSRRQTDWASGAQHELTEWLFNLSCFAITGPNFSLGLNSMEIEDDIHNLYAEDISEGKLGSERVLNRLPALFWVLCSSLCRESRHRGHIRQFPNL